MAATELEQWQIRQSRTFSKWVNMYVAKKGYTERCEDGAAFGHSWESGVLLMKLVHSLYDVPMPRKYKKDPKSKVHMLDNVNQALKMLETAEVKTVNLKQTSILNADWNMMAGMCWCIILDYNIKGISVEDATAKQGLLIWCQKKTKHYKGINGKIHNFTKAWKNGNAFLALVDKHTTGVVNYDEMYEQSAEEKLDAAFTACENLGVPRLLEVEDLTEVERPDDKAVMTYVSELFKLFSKEDIKENAANHISKFLSFQRRVDDLVFSYNDRFTAFKEWAQAKTTDFNDAEPGSTQIECAEKTEAYKEYLLHEKPAKLVEVVDIQDLYANIQGELKVNGRNSFEPAENCKPEDLHVLVHSLNEAEDKASEAIRVTRLGFIEKLDGEETLSAEKKAEIESAFTAFDADNSGMLDKTEFRAALCAIGVALSDPDFDKVFEELQTEAHIDSTTFANYLEEFFTTSDDAESIVKSLQVLGDPNNVTEEMLSQPPLTEEDIAYLMGKAEDGSLAGFINSSFAC